MFLNESQFPSDVNKTHCPVSCFWFLLQPLRREEGFGAKIDCRHKRIPDSSLRMCLSLLVKSKGTTLSFHGAIDQSFVHTLAYSLDAMLNRSPATFSLKTNASFSFPVSVFLEALPGAALWIVIGAGNIPKL